MEDIAFGSILLIVALSEFFFRYIKVNIKKPYVVAIIAILTTIVGAEAIDEYQQLIKDALSNTAFSMMGYDIILKEIKKKFKLNETIGQDSIKDSKESI
jgi:xanthosine utilization system XapX-like protein